MADRVVMVRALDTNGSIVSDATAYFFAAGTTTPLTVYSDKLGAVAHGVSVAGNADGSWPDVFTTASLKIDVQDGAGTSLPGYPRDYWHSTSTVGVGASSITHEPNENNSATNVQAAIDALSTLWGAVTTYGKSLIAAADAAAARTVLGLGDAATRDVGGNSDFTLAPTDLPTRAAVKTFVDTEIAAVDAPDYEGAETAVPAAAGTASWSHGLGSTPRKWNVYLKCTTAADGYAIGDIIPLTYTGNANNIGIAPWANATTISVRVGASGYNILNASTGVSVVPTSSNYRLIAYAWE